MFGISLACAQARAAVPIVGTVVNLATTYFVSTTGDDANNGLDSTSAWLSMDKGDQDGVLQPGDTIYVMSGNHALLGTIQLQQNGTEAAPIVYSNLGNQRAKLNGGNNSFDLLSLEGTNTVITGLELHSGTGMGISVIADSCTITDCYIRDIGSDGIHVEGKQAKMLRNILAEMGGHGVHIHDAASGTSFHGNTVFSCALSGVELLPSTPNCRVFNNIIISNGSGINTTNGSGRFAFNDVWNNSVSDYGGNAADSAGGKSVDPLLEDPALGDFKLQIGSPAIDAGLDIGYSYNGGAPDMGAIEFPNGRPIIANTPDQTVNENENLNFGISATDPESSPLTLTVEDFPPNSNFNDNGDGTGDIDFNPDFTQAGNYSLRVIASDGQLSDTDLVSIDVINTNRPPVLNAIGAQSVDEGQTLNFTITGSDPDGDSLNFELADEPDNASLTDKGDGSADFSFSPDNDQAGSYSVWFIVSDGEAADSEQVSIIVTDVNVAPVWVPIGPQSVEVGKQLTTNVRANDPDGTPLTLTAENLPVNASFLDQGNDKGRLTFTPDGSQVGAHIIRFIASDGALSDTEMVTITVIDAADLSYAQVEYFDGTVVGDTTLKTDNDTTLIYCRAYDAGDALLGDLAVVWSVVGNDSIGTVTVDTAAFTTLVLSRLGTGKVAAYYSATVADTSGVITCESGALTTFVISPNTATISADSSLQFTAVSQDADGNVTTPQMVPTWGVTGGIGSISVGGLLDATTVGSGSVTATNGVVSDTSGAVEVTAGTLARLEVSPDSVVVSVSATQQFTAAGFDSDDNNTAVGTVNWSLTESLGMIDATGLFSADSVGLGRVIGQSGSIVDTTSYLEVSTNILVSLQILPDSIDVRLGDTIQFSAVGKDADSNLTDVGVLTWTSLSRAGSIDSSGLFVAHAAGRGKVAVVSSVNAVADTSGGIDVEELVITPIALGYGSVRPGQTNAPLLGFHLQNYFDTVKTINSLTLRYQPRGPGSAAELRSNVDSVLLFLDLNNDSLLSAVDSLIAGNVLITDVVTLNFSALDLAPDSSVVLMAAVRASLFPRDGDTLDLLILPPADVEVDDGASIVIPDTLNSIGGLVVDGLVGGQITLTPTGVTTMAPGDSLYHVMTVDIPRNGYRPDTLTLVSVTNNGNADTDDIDSMFLFTDDGDGIWGGAESEEAHGNLVYTGSLWIRSGLNVPLTDAVTRFFVAAKVSAFASNGATVALTIPLHGLEVASANDGPTDLAPASVDNIVIQATEALAVSGVSLGAAILTPGQTTPPLIGWDLINRYAGAVAVDSLAITWYAVDPDGATQGQLDSQADSILLYLSRDNNHAVLGPNDSLLGTGTLTSGQAVIDVTGLTLAAGGGTAEITAVAAISLQSAKDGNLINLGLAGTQAVFCSSPKVITGVFPIKNNSDHIVNSFTASAIVVNELERATLFGAQTDNVVFDFEMPRNGYASDELRSLRLVNNGSLQDNAALANLRLYADLQDDGFTPDDKLLRQFSYVSGGWSASPVNRPLDDSLTRFLAVADVSEGQFVGGTLRFQIPILGVLLRSDADGPDDSPVGQTNPLLVVPSNRVTAISIPAQSSSIWPGRSDNIVLTFALYNGYAGQTKRLDALNLTNSSRGELGQSFMDFELGQLSLYIDADRNRLFENDPLVGLGFMSDGLLQLTGLDVPLAPESLTYFFVATEVPLGACDSDSLAVSIANPSDLDFSDPVVINGDMPLQSGGYLIVDGSVTAQYELQPLTPRTLSPGDTSVVLFAFRPAVCGMIDDTLQSVTIANLLDAASIEIPTLELWTDVNGDDVWQSSDSLRSTFSFLGGFWTAGWLNIELPAGNAPTLFAVADIGASATPGTAFQGVIPIGGCTYASDNDGPIDDSLAANETFIVSASSLRVSQPLLKESYSVGAIIELRMAVTNRQAVSVDSISAVILNSDYSPVAVLDSADAGPVTLAAGETRDFVLWFSANQAGSALWQLQAVAPTIADSSAVITTSLIAVQTAPVSVTIDLASTIPTAVTKGQQHIFPLSIHFAHPDTMAGSAALRLDSIRFAIADGQGAPQPAGVAFSRMVLSSGYKSLAVLESVPSLSELTMLFSQPVILYPGQEQNLTLLVGIDSLATANSFAIGLSSSSALVIVDDNTGDPISIDPSVTFPLMTPSCRIDVPSREMATSYESMLTPAVNYGQRDVDLLKLQLRHPGPVNSSQIQLTKLSIKFLDENGAPTKLAALADEIKVFRRQTIIGELTGNLPDTTVAEIVLGSPVTLSPGGLDSLRLVASISPTTTLAGFSCVIDDSTMLDIRDLSSGAILTIVSDTILAAGNVFPMATSQAFMRQQAVAPQVCLSPGLPESIVGGADSLLLAEFLITYETVGNFSPLEITQANLEIVDSMGRYLDPSELFDRVGFRVNGGSIFYQSSILWQVGAAVFDLSGAGISVAPGDSVRLQLVGDFEADNPFDHFVLRASSADALLIQDGTDTTNHPGFLAASGCTTSFPFVDDITYVFLPAGRPSLSSADGQVKVAFAGQNGLSIWESRVVYESPGSQGDISLYGIFGQFLKHEPSGFVPVAGRDVFDSIHLILDNQTTISIEAPATDSLILNLPTPFEVSNGTQPEIRLVVDIRDDVKHGNYVIKFSDSTFLSISDKNLATTVYPALSGLSYPVLTTEISITAAGLERSFTNYPNPFNASEGGSTTIAFVLGEAARINIEIYSITGDLVMRLVDNAYKSVGSNYETWAGFNGAGRPVVPGTYFCRITATYGSGRVESFRRKVAVVR